MKDEPEKKKLPDEPEIEPEMYMFFNRLLNPDSEKKDEPEPEISTDYDDDHEVISGVREEMLEKLHSRLSDVLDSVRKLDIRYQQYKDDTDARISGLIKLINGMKHPEEKDEKISKLTKLVSEMMSMMKMYAGVRV